MSTAVAGIPDLNSPSFLLTIFWIHHDGADSCISIPAGSPLRTLKYIETTLFRFPCDSDARTIPTVTFTGSPLHMGTDKLFHMYWSLASTLRKVSVMVTLSGMVSMRWRQLWYTIPCLTGEVMFMILQNVLDISNSRLSSTNSPASLFNVPLLLFSIFVICGSFI